MKMLLGFFAIIVATLIGVHTVLQNGSFVHYLDTHPDPKLVPATEFYIAEGYYLMRDLENSATYYQRISERYPQSSYAEDAYFNYLVSLDEMNTPRPAMAEAYATYLEKFPSGQYTEIVQRRVDNCRNNR